MFFMPVGISYWQFLHEYILINKKGINCKKISSNEIWTHISPNIFIFSPKIINEPK